MERTTTYFRILVRTLQGNILTFTVNEYEVTEGDFVSFTDEKTGREKCFHASCCEIEALRR